MYPQFIRLQTPEEKLAANEFLDRHNQRGRGSTQGYVAYYAAVHPPDGRALPERLVAVAKFCPLHTAAAARFFAPDDSRHVYCLQRLAACQAPENLLSRFVAWCLGQEQRNPRVHYVATYADAGCFNPVGRPHLGTIYQATNAVYCGMSQARRLSEYVADGRRHSIRRGRKTLRRAEIPATVAIVAGAPKYRYCWALGRPLERAFRRRALMQRMARFRPIEAYQPRLFIRRLLAVLLKRGTICHAHD